MAGFLFCFYFWSWVTLKLKNSIAIFIKSKECKNMFLHSKKYPFNFLKYKG